MTDLIEKVAREIVRFDLGADQFGGVDAQEVRGAARAAIAAVFDALQEPSKQMIEDGADELDSQQDSATDSDGNSYSWVFSGAQTAIFQTMIATARREAFGADTNEE